MCLCSCGVARAQCPGVPVLLQGHSWIGLLISPQISTSRALPGNLYLVPTAVGGWAKGGLWGTQPWHWGAAAPWGQQGDLEGDKRLLCLKSSTSLYPWNLLYPCVLSHHIPASGQASLQKNVPPQRADSDPKQMWVCEVSLIFFFSWEIAGLFHEREACSSLLEGARS